MIPGSKRDHPTLKHSFGFAFQGFRFAFKSERNIKIMALVSFVGAVLGFILGFDAISWAIFALCCACVLSAELMNTAIETLTDLVSPEYNVLAGKAKDIAAAAVWILCLFVAIVGLLLYAHALHLI